MDSSHGTTVRRRPPLGKGRAAELVVSSPTGFLRAAGSQRRAGGREPAKRQPTPQPTPSCPRQLRGVVGVRRSRARYIRLQTGSTPAGSTARARLSKERPGSGASPALDPSSFAPGAWSSLRSTWVWLAPDRLPPAPLLAPGDIRIAGPSLVFGARIVAPASPSRCASRLIGTPVKPARSRTSPAGGRGSSKECRGAVATSAPSWRLPSGGTHPWRTRLLSQTAPNPPPRRHDGDEFRVGRDER
jgi:hypothetical protein